MPARPATEAPGDASTAPGCDLARTRKLAWGYAGGLALAAGASWLRVALAGTFRIDTHTLAFVVASLVLGLGLGLASACGWHILKAAPGLPRAHLLRWAALAQLAVVFAVPLTSSDFYHYLAYGRLQLIGKNPFAVGATALGPGSLLDLVSPRWAGHATAYGPVMNLLFRAAAELGALVGSPLWGSAVAFKLMMAACSLAILVLAERYLRAHRPGADGASALAVVAFSPLLAWEITGQAHNDGVLTLALMVFVWAATGGRELAAVLALAAGTYAKMTLAPVLALYLLFLLRRRGVRAVGYGAAALVMGAVLMIPYVSGFPGFGPMTATVRASARSHSLGDLLDIVLAPFGRSVQDVAVRACFILCIAVCAAAFAAAALRARTVPQLLRGALVFLLAWDMTVPLFQPWYVTWLFPLAIADADSRWQRLVCIYGIWTVLQWAIQLDPLTTVVLNGYVVWKAIQLLRTGALEEEAAAGPLYGGT